MKKILLSSVFAAAFGMFVACGDDSGSNSNSSSDGSATDEGGAAIEGESYASEEEMPNCTATREGDIAEVDGEYFLCVPKKWRTLAGSAATVCGLPVCDDDLEEAYFYASSAETYFQCVEGEWLDADGKTLSAEIALKCFEESLAETAVESEDDLPNCTAKRKGIFVLAGEVVNLCDGEDWIAMLYVASSVDEFPSCTSKREGKQSYAIDEETVYTCVKEEWAATDKASSKSSSSIAKSSSSKGSVDSSGDEDPDAKSSSSKTKSSSSVAPKSSSSTSKSSSSGAKPIVDEDAMMMTDNRTGITYKLKNIGGILWTTTNLVYGTESKAGVYCTENDMGENVCEKYGTFYDFSRAQNACPSGWRLPTREEAAAALDVSTDPSWKWVLTGRFQISDGEAEYGKEGSEGRLWVTGDDEYNTLQLGDGWNDWLDADDRGQNIRCVTESSAPASSSSAVVPVQGVCAASVMAIEKGGSAEWSFTRMSGAKVETYSWEFSDGTTSTDASPVMIYSVPGTYTAKVTVNKGMESESTTECSGLKVNGTPISGCECGFAADDSGIRDIAEANPITVKWAVSGCENADGSTEFAYEWSDGVKVTADGASAEFTGRTKKFTPSVTVTNADGTSMTATCPTVNIDDSENPEYVIDEIDVKVEIPDGACVTLEGDALNGENLRCGHGAWQTSECEYTIVMGGESVTESDMNCLVAVGRAIPISSVTANKNQFCVTMDGIQDNMVLCQVAIW